MHDGARHLEVTLYATMPRARLRSDWKAMSGGFIAVQLLQFRISCDMPMSG
jgi:hypothetical protein